jgi:hypothetical protein
VPRSIPIAILSAMPSLRHSCGSRPRGLAKSYAARFESVKPIRAVKSMKFKGLHAEIAQSGGIEGLGVRSYRI